MAKKKKANVRKHKETEPVPINADAPRAGDLEKAEQLLFGGSIEQAEEMLRGLLRPTEEDRKRLDGWGHRFMDRQRFDGAATVFRLLTGLFPDEPRYFNSLSVASAMGGEFGEALSAQNRAVELEPQSRLRRLNLGKLHMMMGEWARAEQALSQALELPGENHTEQVQELLANCREKMAEAPLPDDSVWQWGGDATEETDYQAGRDNGTDEAWSAPAEAQVQANDELAEPWRADPLADMPQGQNAVKLSPEPEPENALPAPQPAPIPANMRETKEAPAPARSLNILFVQEAPCIRNYKMAVALRGRGHRVTLAYTRARLSQMYTGLADDSYDECIKITSYRHLWDISGDYDLLHCHNEPDVMAVAAMAGKAPVVHDTHDLISLRAGGDQRLGFFEGVANRGAQGRVYTTAFQHEETQRLYGVEGPCLVFNNYASQADLPRRFLPKLSASDGQTHLVYEGGISQTAHRDFSDLFFFLAQNGLVIHIYPVHHDPELDRLFAQNERIHYHQPASPKDIMEKMTQYDVGIIPFNLEKGNRRFLDSTQANKLYEYLAAGLPVVTSNLATYREFFAANPVGFTFETGEEILQKLPGLRQSVSGVDLTAYVKTYEGEIHRMEEFYLGLVEPKPAEQEPVMEPAASVRETAFGLSFSGLPASGPGQADAGPATFSY